MNLLANTSAADGIAIVVFATVLFLILFGCVAPVKGLLRLLMRRDRSVDEESVGLFFETPVPEDSDEDGEENHLPFEVLEPFSRYLQQKLLEGQAGRITNVEVGETEIYIHFQGRSAERIWELLHPELTRYSPAKPLRAILRRPKTTEPEHCIDAISWAPDPRQGFPIPPAADVPPIWLRLARLGRSLGLCGFADLIVWNALAHAGNLTENEFRATQAGSLLAYLFCTLLVAGLGLGLVSGIRIRAILKTPHFDTAETDLMHTLKYVLLVVIGIFAAVFYLTCR